VDLVHFLTPQVAGKYLRDVIEVMPCVSTIHHVMDDETIAAAWPADAVMTASRLQEAEIIARGVPAQAVMRVPYGVDTNLFRPGDDSQQRMARLRFGIPRGAVAVGFIGSRNSDDRGRKGTDTLIRSALELVRREQRTTIVLVGTGWRDVAAAVRSSGGRCIEVPFIPSRVEFAEVYRALDFYWVTSRVEGGPVPLLEAMASGLVVISTPVGLAPEVVEHGRNGFIVNHGDVAGFVDLTGQLGPSSIERAVIGERAREMIINHWQWEQTATRAMPLYRLALQNAELRLRRNGHSHRTPEVDHTRAGRMSAAWKRWIAAREELQAMRFLISSGDWSSGRRAAIRAICRMPLNPRTWKIASEGVPGSFAAYTIGRVLSRLGFPSVPGGEPRQKVRPGGRQCER
jgi:hypothetical protein